jgi:arylformamidase
VRLPPARNGAVGLCRLDNLPWPAYETAHAYPRPVKLIDISRPIYTGMPVWPGDSPVDFSLTAMKAKGSDANVGRLSLCVHAGTHADAVFHYAENGARMDEIPLDVFVGPARVVDVRGHSLITTELLAAHDFGVTPRVLFRSDAWTDPAIFPTEWPVFSADVPGWLAARGVRLVGLDVPSVDKLTSTGMPIHHVIERAGLFILESLDLHHVPPGVYELIALPLRIRGADGSPIRAVLRAG